MASSSIAATLIGCTGLVGSHILKHLIANPAVSSVHTYSRRQPNLKEQTPKLAASISSELSAWETELSTLHPAPALFFSAFGTTRAAAGGFDGQYRVEHDTHLAFIRAAKQAGSRVCVLVSSTNANAGSWVPYARMKGEIEKAVLGMGFDATVILRPGLILGDRQESRPPEAAARWFVELIGKVSTGVEGKLGQHADAIGRAAVRAGQLALNGEGEAVKRENGKVWILDGAAILKYGNVSGE